MNINNFDKLHNILNFEKGSFYMFQSIFRNKDYQESNSLHYGRSNYNNFWFIDSYESLENQKEDMINYVTATGSRLYLNLDRNSSKKTLMTIFQSTTSYLSNFLINEKDPYINIHNIQNIVLSSSSKQESKNSKCFLFDVDTKDIDLVNKIENSLIKNNSYLTTMKSVNGYHVISKRNFDPNQFMRENLENYKSIVEIKTNASCLVYFKLQ